MSALIINAQYNIQHWITNLGQIYSLSCCFVMYIYIDTYAPTYNSILKVKMTIHIKMTFEYKTVYLIDIKDYLYCVG